MAGMKDYLIELMEETEHMTEAERIAYLGVKFSDMELKDRADAVKAVNDYVLEMLEADS